MTPRPPIVHRPVQSLDKEDSALCFRRRVSISTPNGIGLTTGNDPKGPVTRAARCCAALVGTQETFLPAQRTRSAACACERPITPKPYSIVMIRGANRRPGVVYPVGAGEIAWKLWNLMQMRLL